MNGPNVEVYPLPYYVGPWQYLARMFDLKHAVRQALCADDVVILRTPGNIANCAERLLRRNRQAYAVEVVGDAWDVMAAGATRHPLQPLFQRHFHRAQQRHCAGAVAAAYVTKFALQSRYPTSPEAFCTHYSSVSLPDEAFAIAPRHPNYGDLAKLVTVGSMEQMYKGFDTLLEAVSLCRQQNCQVELTLIGDGKHRREIANLANALEIENHVKFLGELPSGPPVRQQLAKADMFVMASRTEGLPRAMIEAMAMGLPCVATDVGGISELLDQSFLVLKNNPQALADKIMEVLRQRSLMTEASRANLAVAREYHEDVLRVRRREFFEEVKQRSMLVGTDSCIRKAA